MIPDLSINNVMLELRRYVYQKGIRCVVVDYIGRTDALTGRSKNVQPWEVLVDSARRLKTAAKELDITIFMLAQLSKDGSLARASYMLHEADCWFNIAKLEGDDLKSAFGLPWTHKLELRKARSCEMTETQYLRFEGDIMTFTDDQEEAQQLKDKYGKDFSPKAAEAAPQRRRAKTPSSSFPLDIPFGLDVE